MKNMMTWAIALTLMLAALVVSADVNAAPLPRDSDGDGYIDDDDMCPNQARRPAGAIVNMSGCVDDWGMCYLLQLQLGENPDACGIRDPKFTWQQERYETEMLRTQVRLDRYGREVRVGRWNGGWDPGAGKNGRFVQARSGLYGYEGSGVYLDHVPVGRSVLRSDSPPFWSETKTVVAASKPVEHPITSEEVARLQGTVADAQSRYDEAKRYYDEMVRTRGADARELEDAKARLVTATGRYKRASDKLNEFEQKLGEFGDRLGTVEEDVTVLKTAREQNSFYLEGGYSAVFESWHGVLPGGLILDIAPSHRFTVGAAHQFRTEKLIVRGVAQGGLNMRYDGSSSGATVGARVDAFYKLIEKAPMLRFGGSMGLEFDWYHLSHGRTPEGIYSISLSLRLVPQVGVSIDLGDSPMTLTVLGGVRTGPTWVGIREVNTPHGRFGGQIGVRLGGRFGPTK
ncbi:hypothetical protein HQ524_02365 [Candidatus Uhrbacteria bacterium]|nr:hypothetical protein [Candidatus Uhrbacteria bacterium]